MQWLRDHDWRRLVSGEKLEFRFAGHPRAYGFRKIVIAEQVGQVEDWVLSLNDGSRLHVWLMPDRRWIMHRDAIDPAAGPVEAAAHIVTETRIGSVLLGAAAVIGVAWLGSRLARA